MAHWACSEITAGALLKKFPKYADQKVFKTEVIWKDLVWDGLCGYHVIIHRLPTTPHGLSSAIINFRICEQPGCCGCANLFYVHVSDYCYLQEAYDMAMWVARTLKLAYIKFAGTKEQDRLMKIFQKDGWHKAGSAHNGRYSERGNEIFVYTKKLNIVRRGKGAYPRKYGY